MKKLITILILFALSLSGFSQVVKLTDDKPAWIPGYLILDGSLYFRHGTSYTSLGDTLDYYVSKEDSVSYYYTQWKINDTLVHYVLRQELIDSLNNIAPSFWKEIPGGIEYPSGNVTVGNRVYSKRVFVDDTLTNENTDTLRSSHITLLASIDDQTSTKTVYGESKRIDILDNGNKLGKVNAYGDATIIINNNDSIGGNVYSYNSLTSNSFGYVKKMVGGNFGSSNNPVAKRAKTESLYGIITNANAQGSNSSLTEAIVPKMKSVESNIKMGNGGVTTITDAYGVDVIGSYSAIAASSETNINSFTGYNLDLLELPTLGVVNIDNIYGLKLNNTSNKKGVYDYYGIYEDFKGTNIFKSETIIDTTVLIDGIIYLNKGKNAWLNRDSTNTSIYIGDSVGMKTVSGALRNVGIGYYGLKNLTTGDNNAVYGYGAGENITDQGNNVLIGSYAGNSLQGGGNVFIGFNSGRVTKNSTLMTGIGQSTLLRDTSGVSSVAIGNNSLFNDYNSIRNTAIGFGSGRNNTGDSTVFIGNEAGYNNTGTGNVFIGLKTGYNNTLNNRFMVDNSDTDSPLIDGYFDNDLLRINGQVELPLILAKSTETDVLYYNPTTDRITYGSVGVGGDPYPDLTENTYISGGDSYRFDITNTTQMNLSSYWTNGTDERGSDFVSNSTLSDPFNKLETYYYFDGTGYWNYARLETHYNEVVSKIWDDQESVQSEMSFSNNGLYIYTPHSNGQGAWYGADYSTALKAIANGRGIPDLALMRAEISDSIAASGGGSYTASNGITLSGSEFKLGGDLEDGATINFSDNRHLYYSSDGITMAGGSELWQLNCDVYSGNDNTNYPAVAIGVTQAYMGANTEVRVNNSGIRIQDDNSLLGAYYNADYSSAGLSNLRWIPDLAAVQEVIHDSIVANPGGSYTAGNAMTLTGSAFDLGGDQTGNVEINGKGNSFAFYVEDAYQDGIYMGDAGGSSIKVGLQGTGGLGTETGSLIINDLDNGDIALIHNSDANSRTTHSSNGLSYGGELASRNTTNPWWIPSISAVREEIEDSIQAIVPGSGDYSDGGDVATADRTLGNTDNYDLGFITNNLNRFHISNAGSIGINTTAPHSNSLVHIKDGSAGGTPIAQSQLLIESDQSTGITIWTPSNRDASLTFSNNTHAYNGQIKYSHSEKEMRFYMDGQNNVTFEKDTIQAKSIRTSEDVIMEKDLRIEGTVIKPTGVIADNDLTPSVAGGNVWTYDGTATAVTITDLDDPVVGAEYTIIGNSDTYTLTINDSGNFNLSATFVGGADDVIVLRCIADNNYIEITRSDN